MTAHIKTSVHVHDVTSIVGHYYNSPGRDWLALTDDGGEIDLWADSTADIAATLIRLAGEALPHLDDEGRAVVAAAVREAFGVVGERESRRYAAIDSPNYDRFGFAEVSE